MEFYQHRLSAELCVDHWHSDQRRALLLLRARCSSVPARNGMQLERRERGRTQLHRGNRPLTGICTCPLIGHVLTGLESQLTGPDDARGGGGEDVVGGRTRRMLPHGGLFWPSLAPEPPQLDHERFAGLGCDRVQYEDGFPTSRNKEYGVKRGVTVIVLRAAAFRIQNGRCCNIAFCFRMHVTDVLCEHGRATKGGGEGRKSEPDNGTALWGDPELANARPIRRWLVAEGEEEDLEDALARQPFCGSDNEMNPSSFESGDSQGWPLPFPKPVTKNVFTGWTLCNPREDWSKWRSLTGVLCDKKIPERLNSKIYRTAVRPVALYGATFWLATKDVETRLSVMEMKMLRWTAGVTPMAAYETMPFGRSSVSCR
ncbi:unnamed protein product [Heligmosomoides polygyrus]|uniref:Reverse transcriptase domain-containing protein n=1 Tax=Heligmosomoides polygyrus TaxID=6339 RepID=A0A3P8BH99_HELPZ|nr:unnamed protein product [Heligmosomoides polygyrus]